jgi:amino acid transporter
MLNMIGIGPFLTIPLALAAMGGPQAMLGWILGAFISLCDGMVWAELGSAMPRSGGPYHYLMEAFGPRSFGRLFSFLFLWQAILLGPISIAGGAVGFAQYAGYLLPNMHHGGSVVLAASVCLVNTALLYRNIRSISHLSIATAIVVLGSTVWIIVTGVLHFHPAMAFDFPPHAFHLDRGFFLGLGASTLIAMYDYGGYYNVCLIGDEVSSPKRTIPRSILFSIVVVAILYLIMNLSIIGVVPWRDAMHSQTIVADFMVRIYGPKGGTSIAILILIASFGSVFAILLGYSRIPYAAAVEGQFFPMFGRLHRKGNFPYISLLAMGLCSAVACLFSLQSLITSLIVTQTLLQFAAQCVAVILLRRQKREPAESYRMPLYPLPALVALVGWTYVVVTSGLAYIALAGVFLIIGIVVYLLRARQEKAWPFAEVVV